MNKFVITGSNLKNRIKVLNTRQGIAFLFIAMLLFKFASELGYYLILIKDVNTYKLDFNIWKYMNGFVWCVILFLGIRHGRKRVSGFMLYLTYLIQIIPITVIYEFANENAVYYNMICVSFLLCELLCGWGGIKTEYISIRKLSKLMIITCAAALIMLVLYIYKENGLPTLIALDIDKVYELRVSSLFQINKYASYLLNWMMAVIVPFLIAKTLNSKQYIKSGMLCCTALIIYLYTGHKSYLFSLPLVIICTVWARRRNFYKEIFITSCTAFFMLVMGACFSPVYRLKFEYIYSLLGRRVMMVSANNKFAYYDYFTKNPKMGLGGIFPRWLINIPNYYENINYTHLISDIYYGKPDMRSNTGFIAEGYMRFGYAGIVIIFILLAILLIMIDKMQKRAGYIFTIGAFCYPVFMLTDTHLFDTVFFGSWMIVVLLLFFYSPEKKERNEKNDGVCCKGC